MNDFSTFSNTNHNTNNENDQPESVTQRQQREIDYHRDHAQRFEKESREISFDILRAKKRSWWNASWSMYTDMIRSEPAGKRVLVVGCGFGEDAIRLAAMGAQVSAFDISPDVLTVARQQAKRHNVEVDFTEMPCEKLGYEDDSFDWVIVRDILHHVEIDQAMGELGRVCRQGSMFFANEVYSHSCTNLLRRNALVDKWLYPKLKDRIYDGKAPYITADERKCDQRDIALIRNWLGEASLRYFSFLSGRLFSPTNATIARIDRAALACLGPVGRYLGGRILIKGHLRKSV